MSSDGCGNDLKDPKFEVCPGVLVSAGTALFEMRLLQQQAS